MWPSTASRSPSRSARCSSPLVSASSGSSGRWATATSRSSSCAGLGQPLDAEHQGVAQRVRRRAAAVEAGGEQLLAVQRVAAGAGPQPLQQLGLRRRAEDVRQLVGQLGVRERLERDPAGARVSLELGQQRPQRVAAVHLVRPVGADDEHALGLQAASQERERRARRAVRPVQVLDQQQHRLAGRARPAARAGPRTAAPARRPRCRTRPARARGARPGSSGATAARTGSVSAGSPERASGRSAATSGTYGSSLSPRSTQSPASTSASPSGARCSNSSQQARLADARVAGHEGQRRSPVGGVGQRGLELRQFGGAADQAGARDPGAHLAAVSALSSSSAQELMQYRMPPASRGPSSKRWPRWPPHACTRPRCGPCPKSGRAAARRPRRPSAR